MSRPAIVVAAAFVEQDGRVLLTRRPAGTHLAGLWEFPGGKVERGESPEECLVRELREELGVTAYALKPFTFVHWRYPDRDVLLLLFRSAIEGEPQALHASALGWFTLTDARLLPMPDADVPLLEAIAAAGGPAGHPPTGKGPSQR